jgi:15-cis-phytoene synthase
VKPESAALAAQALRDSDHDRYLATLVLPAERRDAVTALYAFNAEIASIAERAREPAAGEIRLRWWADALEGVGHGEVRANPVADALLAVVETYRLPTAALSRMIEARRFDLYQDPMPDLATFEGYAGDTASAIYQLGAMVLNDGRPVETGDAAGHLGVAHALIGHLRAFGYHASRGRIFLPWAIFATCGVTEQDVLGGHPTEAISVALTRLSEVAGEHLRSANEAVAKLPRELRAAFAPVAMVKAQLGLLNYESPFQPPRDFTDWRKILQLAGWRLRRG